MLKKRYLLIFTILALCFLLPAGCGEEQVVPAEEPIADLDEVDSNEKIETVTVTDQMGREVVFEGIPEHIISMSPSNTEVSFALGLGERIVGVTEYCNYPPEAQEREIIGGFSTPNIELIVEMQPDLVLASTIHEEEVPRLEELGIPVLVVESSTLQDLYTSIALVARVTGVVDAGEVLINSMQEEIAALQTVVADIPEDDRIRVYYEVYSDPLMTAGKDAFITEIIALAGGVSIFGDVEESYPQISAEVVAEREPQVILYPDYHGTADLVIESMTERPGWESIPAVIENRVYAVSDDAFARPGPRAVEAVAEAAKIFYPELFQ